MKKAILLNLKIMLNRRELYFSVFLLLLISTLHIILIFQHYFDWGNYFEWTAPAEYQLLLTATGSDFRYLSILLIPTLATFVFSDSYLEEKQNGAIRNLVVRISQKKYVIAKMVVVVVSTFILVLFTLLFQYLIQSLIYRNELFSDISGTNLFNIVTYPDFLENIRVSSLFLFTNLQCIKFAFLSSLIALSGFTLSLYLRNRVAVIFIPTLFIIINLLIFDALKLSQFSLVNMFMFIASTSLTKIAIVVSIILIINGFFIHKKLKSYRSN